MNYKKIIPNQELRLKILKFLDFIPDKTMIKFQYKIKTGRKLDLKNPERFTEKIQWYKLNLRDPLMTKCSDKFSVRDYVKSKGKSNILIPLYGVWSRAEEINFNELPKKFVLKTTNGSHTNIICKNKDELNFELTIKQLNGWLERRRGKSGREWAYYDIKPRIICEKYLEIDELDSLIDYKFFCFNGVPYCLYVITDRYSHGGIKLGIFDINFNKLPYYRADIKKLDYSLAPPKDFKKMIEIAKLLSKDFLHARVDLYNINGEIFFGELTFYDGSGYQSYLPNKFDFELGNEFILP